MSKKIKTKVERKWELLEQGEMQDEELQRELKNENDEDEGYRISEDLDRL